MKAPKPEVMFERLLMVLKLERSMFVPEGKSHQTFTSHGVRWVKSAHMTKGLTLQGNSPGDGVTRWSVSVHSRVGTGQILFSLGAKAFAEKVWAIEAGIECARALGVNVGDL